MSTFNSTVFQQNPTRLDISRSKFDLSHEWTGTFNTGLAIPCFSYGDVLPGDTFTLDASMVIRSTTPIAPVMDNAYADIYFFFVPHKLTLSRQMMSPSTSDSNHSWAAIIGAQDSLLNMPLPDSGAQIPVIEFGKFSSSGYDGNFDVGSLSDYLGLPDFTATTSYHRFINCLEPLAYYCVWNNYFRDPNTMNPVTYSIGTLGTESAISLQGGIGFSTAQFAIGSSTNSVLPVCREHGYFGSALPWPQRNSTAVELPLGDLAPVIVMNTGTSTVSGITKMTSGSASLAAGAQANLIADNGASMVNVKAFADLSEATAANVNELRQAIQLQRWYEASARGGNSLSDMTAAMFGVTPAFAHADRPEYLGGKRIPISVQQVNNTAGTYTSGQQALQNTLGSTGAYSLTYDRGSMFTKSFDTWGTIVGIVCVRTHDSFHQGLARRYSRRSKFDFYWPQFANLGEQAILEKEIYMQGDDGTLDDVVFGYQEAWAEYRYENDIKVGYCRPGNGQAYWNYCNDFSSAPTLAGYLNASSEKTNVDNTLQVKSDASGFQWMANIAFDVKAVRPMPTYSIPGLMDHH